MAEIILRSAKGSPLTNTEIDNNFQNINEELEAAQVASDISFTPVGGLAATDVQAALAELDSEKQAALGSGTNIKTINGASVLGSGDLEVGGGHEQSFLLMGA